MKSTLLTLAMICGAAIAQETVTAPEISTQGSGNDWNLKLGISYRKFKDPKFSDKRAVQFSANAARISGSYAKFDDLEKVKNDILNDKSNPYPYAKVDIIKASVSDASASGKGDYGLWESCGLVLGGSFTLSESNSLRLSLVADFQYFQNDSGKNLSYTGGTGEYETYLAVKSKNNTAVELNLDGDSLGGGSISGLGGGTAKMTMEMDLYVFDLGLSVGYEFENSLSLFLSAGPTISIADIDSTCRTAGERKRSDNDTEVEYGLFVSAGAAFWFNERFGLSAEVRYDKSFGEVGTHFVTQDLDAWGGNLAFLVRF
ncbi:MAG: hypothetical protein IKP00_16160 [Victivallales bacterium]|nr:hypothetical protein [Victivallales bacterium]